MSEIVLPSSLKNKIFEIKYESNNTVSKIISYFPFSETERNEIISILNNNFNGFYSIFKDLISAEEWDETKVQIKKKFQNELFDIDKLSKH